MSKIDEFIYKYNISQIFLDADGVIFASCDAIIQILNERYGGDFKGSDVTSWDFQCCYPNMTSEEIEDTFADPRFFEIVKPIKGALEFIDRYKDKIVIVTKAVTDNFIHIFTTPFLPNHIQHHILYIFLILMVIIVQYNTNATLMTHCFSHYRYWCSIIDII